MIRSVLMWCCSVLMWCCEARRGRPGIAVAAGCVLVAVAAGVGLGAGSASAATPVLGLDVSDHQAVIDWSAVASGGTRFAYVKATEGTGFVNPDFASQYDGSYQAGLIRGAYHFALPSVSIGAAQASYFVANGGGWSADGRTLPGALDLEPNPHGARCYGLSQNAMVAWIASSSAPTMPSPRAGRSSTAPAAGGRHAPVATTGSRARTRCGLPSTALPRACSRLAGAPPRSGSTLRAAHSLATRTCSTAPAPG